MNERLILLQRALAGLLGELDALDQAGEELDEQTQNELADEIEALYTAIDEVQSTTQAPPSADAQLLWVLAGQQEDAFISYLRNYPSAATNALLNNPGELSATIRRLSQMMPPGEPPVENGIAHSDLNSSNIWGSAYNPKTRRMKVRFQSGSEYEYDGVPPNIYRAFASGNADAKTKGANQYGRWWVHKNPSLGAALNQYIKAGNFKYRRTN